MAEGYGSSEKSNSHSNQNNYHRPGLKLRNNRRKANGEASSKQFIDELQNAIKLFSINSTKERLQHMEANKRCPTNFVLTSLETDDSYDPEIEELALKDEYRTRAPRHFQKVFLYDPDMKELIPIDKTDQHPSTSTSAKPPKEEPKEESKEELKEELKEEQKTSTSAEPKAEEKKE